MEATGATLDDEEGVKHTRKSKRRIRRASLCNRKITIDTKTETLRMPSDVKDESSLQKVAFPKIVVCKVNSATLLVCHCGKAAMHSFVLLVS
ncbi:hypothetical protein ANCCAN_12447 [Ancylostoma caninum]|uniref:Uncharacterized protein n=1 Tax=Ancylostoma caninum TaxID=29170 RepID=A0A368GE95_ANCCA|nr:hypothetical protein ANCCAN_12447 [Ancylostoma caninum]